MWFRGFRGLDCTSNGCNPLELGQCVCGAYKFVHFIGHDRRASFLYVYLYVSKYNSIVWGISESGNINFFMPFIILTWSKFKMKICFSCNIYIFNDFSHLSPKSYIDKAG